MILHMPWSLAKHIGLTGTLLHKVKPSLWLRCYDFSIQLNYLRWASFSRKSAIHYSILTNNGLFKYTVNVYRLLYPQINSALRLLLQKKWRMCFSWYSAELTVFIKWVFHSKNCFKPPFTQVQSYLLAEDHYLIKVYFSVPCNCSTTTLLPLVEQ